MQVYVGYEDERVMRVIGILLDADIRGDGDPGAFAIKALVDAKNAAR